jgi:pimeloyl-ACP methyl ester carboxylesterase
LSQVIEVSEGRRICFDCWGDPKGFPVFLLHGTPGSRNGPVPRGSVLYRLGVQLICYDRPGYGDSGRARGRSVADAAGDVLAIADGLKLDHFGVVGRSGGGPHALACGALIDPDRLHSVAVLVGIAPADAEELNWFDGMTESNVNEYEMGTPHGDDSVSLILTEEILAADFAKRADQIRQDPESLLDELKKEMSAPDRRIVADVAIYRQLLRTYEEAVKYGPYGWLDDTLAFRKRWGFELKEIRVPVLLWHGEDDVFSPAAHSRWMADRIPEATVEVEAGAAHFDAVQFLPRLLARMKTASSAVSEELV